MDKKPVLFTREKNKPVNDPNARSCLISGSPGIGKTSAVRIIAEQLNFDVLELNASDTRGKGAIEELLSDLSQHQFGISHSLIDLSKHPNSNG